MNLQRLLSLILVLCTSCTITIDRFKIKNNYGSVSMSPGQAGVTPGTMFSSIPPIQGSYLYAIGLLNLNTREYIQARGKQVGQDSVRLIIEVRDVSKDSISGPFDIRLPSTISQYSHKALADDRFVITYEFADPSGPLKLQFDFFNVKTQRLNDGMLEIITGEVQNEGQRFIFSVLNDPVWIRSLLGQICATTRINFKKMCDEKAKEAHKNRRTDCVAWVRYSSLSEFMKESKVYCEILCAR